MIYVIFEHFNSHPTTIVFLHSMASSVAVPDANKTANRPAIMTSRADKLCLTYTHNEASGFKLF